MDTLFISIRIDSIHFAFHKLRKCDANNQNFPLDAKEN